MSWDVAEVTNPIARRDYICEASDYVWEQVNEGLFTFTEYRTIVKAKRDCWKIRKGTIYVCCRGMWIGEWTTFRARFDMDALCQKYGLYQE